MNGCADIRKQYGTKKEREEKAMKKKLISALLCVAMVSAMLTGCGSSANQSA